MGSPVCPVCKSESLQPHCPPRRRDGLRCPWDRCTNTACKANVDRVTGHHDHPQTTTCATCGRIQGTP